MITKVLESLYKCRAISLKKTEVVLICLMIWMCFLTLHFQTISIKQFYNRVSNQRFLTSLRNLSDIDLVKKNPAAVTKVTVATFTKLKSGVIPVNAQNKPEPTKSKKVLPVTQKLKNPTIPKKKLPVKNSTDVIKWFENRPSFTPFKTNKKHPHLRKYMVPTRTCKDGPVHILIYMHSRGNAWERRDEMRTSWASRSTFRQIRVERIFLISSKDPEEDDELAYKLEMEISKNDDMVIIDELDSFANLGYKALTILDLINTRCKQAKYILKADDDMFINPFMVVEKLISTIWNKPRTVMCHLKLNAEAIQVKDSRWYIPKDVLPNKKSLLLPKFCSGYAVLFTSDLVPLMLEASYTAPFISVDDIYMFGFLLHPVKNVNFMDIATKLTLNKDIGVEEYVNKEKEIKHLGVNAWDRDTNRKLWNAALRKLSPLGADMAYPALVPK